MARQHSISLLTVAMAGVFIAVTGVAQAGHDTHENDALQINHAKVSITQAIAAAEQQAGDKVSRAAYMRTHAGWAYDIEVVRGQQVFDVKVDPMTGKVLSTSADRAD